VLKSGGHLILSMITPPSTRSCIETDYFAHPEYSGEHTSNGQSAALTCWQRPPQAITDAFIAAGYRVAAVSEPPPAPGQSSVVLLLPDTGKSRSFLCFL
jgi:hypothetical protein